MHFIRRSGADALENAYLFYNAADLPRGFVFPQTREQLVMGLYLPTTHSPVSIRAAAQVLLLLESCIIVGEHPAISGRERIVPLIRLSSMEIGRLIGERWFAMCSDGTAVVCPYSIADQQAVRTFLHEVRRRTMLPISWLGFVGSTSFGMPLTVKLAWALDEELDSTERVFVSFFNAHHRDARAHDCPTSSELSPPADFLGITRRRILWITDRHNQQRQLGGVIARYAPILHMPKIVISAGENTRALLVTVAHGVTWQVPLSSEWACPAQDFVDAAAGTLAEVGRYEPAPAPRHG